MSRPVLLLVVLLLSACPPSKTYSVAEVCGDGGVTGFGAPRQVKVVASDGSDYGGDVEEPEVRDFGGARWLFFNDDPKDGNKDLFLARWDDAQTAFVVLGKVGGDGAQSPAVDGNPTLAQDGTFAFISTRTFPNPTETIHFATLSVSGSPPVATISTVPRASGLTRADSPWASQGVQLTWDGAVLFFDEAKFDGPLPTQSVIRAAKKSGTGYERLGDAEQTALLGNVNHPTFLQYAETLSRDGLTLFFTRTWADKAQLEKVVMCVMRSTRPDAQSGFGAPEQLAVTAPTPGVVMEAPSFSPDEKTLYYHRKEPGGVARLMAVDRL